ncbi:MAG: replicative DNA helicase [Parcubacteria group bacterium Gr01-1014_19]|nr:MAG: replicative DNA helicase [Parcubacteria group bacterium Gr01-1014_19]
MSAKKSQLKLPPQNVEAENSVLGSLMIDKTSIIQIADTLTDFDFYHPANAKIYEAIFHLYEKHQPIDISTVANELKERGTLKELGGLTYLSNLANSVTTASNIVHYAQIVKEKKIMRDMIRASAEIAEKAFNPEGDLEEAMDSIEQKIFSISQRSVPQKFIHVKEGLPKAYERMEKLQNGEKVLGGLSTGFYGLDNKLSGLRNSDLIILGARPSLGKTSLALDIARHVGIRENKPVGIFSLEMSKDQIIDRLISAEAEVSLWKLRTGHKMDTTDFQLIQEALDKLSKAPIFIDDTASPNILQMRSMARRLQAEHGLSLLVVDYLQLIQPRTHSDNMVHQITEISRNLKALGRELNVPILALSQLSRGVEQRDNKVPRLADLRESGSIEQDADIVMLLYREDKTKTNPSPDEQNIAQVIIAKHRNGPLGSVDLRFDQDKASFKNIDKVHNAPPSY